MKRFRVLIVDLWEGPAHVYYTGQLVKAFAQDPKVEIGFLHSAGFRLPDGIEGVRCLSVRAPQNLSAAQLGRVALQPFECMRALNAIRRFNPDVIHLVFSHPWFSALMPIIAKRWPVAVTMHDVTPHYGEETARARLALRATTRHASAIFVHGPTALEEARACYPETTSRLHSIPHGHFDFLNGNAPITDATDPSTFLFYGRILAYKGLGIALAAMQRLIETHPTARLVIAGAGSIDEHAETLRRLASHLEIIHREISDDELAGLMRRCAAVLAPYTHASGSGVVASACAFARPVIGSRLGGLIDMIDDGQTGILFPARDELALAEAMARFINNPTLAASMGRAVKAHALAAWDWHAIETKQMEVFRKISRKTL